MNGLSFWQSLAVLGAVGVTALVSLGALAWRAAHRRARASASGAAAATALPARTTSAFLDLDPRGIAPRAHVPSAEPAMDPIAPMAPPFVPVAPLAIAATTLAGRARAQIRVVATTDSPARAAFQRRSSHLRLVPAAPVRPLDGGAPAVQPAQDARTA